MGRGTGVSAASRSSIAISFEYRCRRCREKIRLPPNAANLKFVENLKARIQHEIAIGTFDYAAHFPNSKHARRLALTPARTVTVGELLTEWLKYVKPQLQPETFEDYSEYVRNVWAPKFGTMLLSQFALVDVARWIAEQSTSKKRILNLLTPLRQALRYAVSPAKLLLTDPLAGVTVRRPPVIKESDIDPFTKAELDAILAQLEPAIANMMEFWAWTGLREGELFALTWADVDFERGVISVNKSARGARRKAPKTKAGNREIKLLPPALDALQRQKPLTRLLHREVFLNPGAALARGRATRAAGLPWNHDKPLRNRWQSACAAAGVRYRFPRQLRHTYASWMLNGGESPLWVSRQMGHADLGITLRVYAKFIADMAPDAGMKAWNQLRGNK
jgi:integrase